MCTRSHLQIITDTIAKKAKSVFNNELEAVFLYGSYARGDETDESDIDILILVDKSKEELSAYKKIFTDLTSELGLDYDTLITATLKDKETFNRYLHAVPFYNNVIKEGIRIAV